MMLRRRVRRVRELMPLALPGPIPTRVFQSAAIRQSYRVTTASINVAPTFVFPVRRRSDYRMMSKL
eukprot:4888963-Pleurochrysis_carterae.AAC.1